MKIAKENGKDFINKLTTTVHTLKGLRNTLFYELDRLRRDEITPQQAREVSTEAQQIMQSVRAKLKKN